MTPAEGETASRGLRLTREHVETYAELTGDRNPLHFDEAFAAATRFGRPIVQGGLTTGLLHALVATDLPGPGTVFLSQEWRFTAPVYIGDRITAHAKVLEVHESKPVTHLEMRVEREGGETVLEGEAWCYTFAGPEAAGDRPEAAGDRPDPRLRPMRPEDWARVREIYAAGIETGEATFETSVPDRATWEASHLDACRLVAEEGGEVVGWAALSPVSDRCAYGGVAEVSVYVDPEARGRGVGSALLEGLVAASEEEGLWTLQAGIFPENEASVRVHERQGFRVVGRRRRLGRLRGSWRDVLLLERRSEAVGLD